MVRPGKSWARGAGVCGDQGGAGILRRAGWLLPRTAPSPMSQHCRGVDGWVLGSWAAPDTLQVEKPGEASQGLGWAPRPSSRLCAWTPRSCPRDRAGWPGLSGVDLSLGCSGRGAAARCLHSWLAGVVGPAGTIVLCQPAVSRGRLPASARHRRGWATCPSAASSEGRFILQEAAQVWPQGEVRGQQRGRGQAPPAPPSPAERQVGLCSPPGPA